MIYLILLRLKALKSSSTQNIGNSSSEVMYESKVIGVSNPENQIKNIKIRKLQHYEDQTLGSEKNNDNKNRINSEW